MDAGGTTGAITEALTRWRMGRAAVLAGPFPATVEFRHGNIKGRLCSLVWVGSLAGALVSWVKMQGTAQQVAVTLWLGFGFFFLLAAACWIREFVRFEPGRIVVGGLVRRTEVLDSDLVEIRAVAMRLELWVKGEGNPRRVPIDLPMRRGELMAAMAMDRLRLAAATRENVNRSDISSPHG